MDTVLKFVERTKLPVYETPMAKGGIDEYHPQFRGVFAGNCSTKQVQKEVYDADLILSIGSMNSDFNTGGFTYQLSQTKTIGQSFSLFSNFSYVAFFLNDRIPYVSHKSLLCCLR